MLNELIDNSAIYSRLISVDERDDNTALERQLLEIRRAMGVPSYLLLLYLLKNEDGLELDDGMVADLVGLLVRFFVRRNVTDTPPTRDLERLFISICEGIEDGAHKGVEVLLYVKARLVRVSASDAAFEERLSGPIYDFNPDMCRYILTTLAQPSVTKQIRPLWDRNASGTYVWTIEHVFPQGENIPQSWVDMIGGGDRELARAIQAECVHKLGNLTLTGYNSKLSNMPFAEKRDRRDRSENYVGYRSGLNLNEDLVSVDVWTQEQIETRTDKLVKMALTAFSLDEAPI